MYECLERAHDVRTFNVLHLPEGEEFVKVDGNRKRPADSEENLLLTSKIQAKVRGHTSFLTFASLYPL